MAEPIVLISGIPAVGKTTFANWLADRKGFLHLDVEDVPFLRESGYYAYFFSIFAGGWNPAAFLTRLRGTAKPVVMSWGVPPAAICISAIRDMKENGIGIWWFDGERKAAREAFIKRDNAHVDALDKQMGDIEAAWEEIHAVFKPNIIQVVQPDGSFLPPEDLYARIFR